MVRLSHSLLLTLLLTSVPGFGQSTKPPFKPPPPPPESAEAGARADNQDLSLPDEMRSRMAIARAEGEHRKLVEDAQKLDELSGDLVSKFKGQNKLSSTLLKTVTAIEKLARRILKSCGGDEVEEPKDAVELSPGSAVERISVAAAQIRKTVSTESRHVVSAHVIDRSNDIIHLTQFLSAAGRSNHE